jgi:hypothetical protein
LEVVLITALLFSPCRPITAQGREKDEQQEDKKKASLIKLVCDDDKGRVDEG